MVKRIPVEETVDPKILGDALKFPTSGRTAKNRFLKAPLSENLAPWSPANLDVNGIPTEHHVNLYEKWSAGGFGGTIAGEATKINFVKMRKVVVTGNVQTDELHLESPGNTIITKELDSPERREIWKRVASESKKHGALIIAQISNAGRQTSLIVNKRPFSSSTIGLKRDAAYREYGIPIELTTEQVKTEIIDKFAYTSKVLFECGFDGVELHGAHGYMIAQFLSRTTNKRTDKYGGSPQNRARIVVDIYEAIRKEIPASTGFIVGIKLNSVEFQREGLTNAEAIQIAAEIDKAGLDFIELSGGTYESLAFKHKRKSTAARESFFQEFAEKIKPAIKNAIVYVTGGFRTVPGMVKAIENNETDGIGLGRPITQDFDLPLKILNGTIQSAPEWPFGDDFISAGLSCQCQMSQAASTPYSPEKDLTAGIMDLTDETTLKEYKSAQNLFMQTAVRKMIDGMYYQSFVDYKNDGKKFAIECDGLESNFFKRTALWGFLFALKIQNCIC